MHLPNRKHQQKRAYGLQSLLQSKDMVSAHRSNDIMAINFRKTFKKTSGQIQKFLKFNKHLKDLSIFNKISSFIKTKFPKMYQQGKEIHYPKEEK